MMNYKEGYIICENHIKMDILNKLALNNEFKNYTFLTLKELKRKLTFDVKKRAIIHLANILKISPYVSKEYIDSLLELNGSFDSKKGKYLKEIYGVLLKENLIVKSDLFVNQIPNKHFTFIDYPHTKELEHVISKLNKENITVLDFESLNLNKEIKYHKFIDIESECAYVFSEIFKLIKNGVIVSDILLCNVNQDYEFIINRYIDTYKLPISFGNGNNITSTKEAKRFFELILENNDFNQIIDKLNKEFYDKTITNKIINLINDYEAYLYNPKDLIKFFQMEFKNINYVNNRYEEEIMMIKINQLNQYVNKHVFLLNFNVEVPKIIKDEAYILDKEKELLGLDSSNALNKINKIKLISGIEKCENLTITFSENHSFNSQIPSPLIKEFKMVKISHDNEDYPFGFEKINDDLYLSKAYDNLVKFNEKNNVLTSFIYEGFTHDTFDNKYKTINSEIIEQMYPEGIKLSYTDMHTYLQCPFKYYCKKVLNIDEFESTLSTRLGTYAHGILEDYERLGEAFDFELSSNKWLTHDQNSNNVSQTSKDLYYLNKMKDHVKYVIERIEIHKSHSSLNNSLCEKKLDLKLYDGKLEFKGFIDKLLFTQDLEYVAIVDYKTGKDKASLNNLVHGENLQLPVYIYLLKNSEMFKHTKIVGVYLQKIDIMIPKKDDNKSAKAQIDNNINLEGYTDPAYVGLIDDTSGDYLKNYSLNKDGSINYHSLIFDQLDVDKLYQIVEEKIDYTFKGIMNARFDITNNVIGNDYVSCKYCNFKDVCFKTSQDIKYLKRVPFKEKAGESDGNE